MRRNVWVSAVALLVAAAAVYLVRLTIAHQRVDQLLAASQQPLSAVLAARQELRVAEATLLAAGQAIRMHGRTLELLEQLTRGLPDSAAITSLTIRDDGSGVLSGLARRAGAAVARLQSRPAFARARLQGPVTREMVAGREWERFTLEWQP